MLVFLILLISLFVSISSNSSIPLYKSGKSKFYFVSTNLKASFLDANEICNQIGRKLVSIESDERNKKLYKLLRKNVLLGDYWTSGTNMLTSPGEFKWLSTNEDAYFPDWEVDETLKGPNRCIKIDAVEHELKWIPVSCNEKLHFICEKNRNVEWKKHVTFEHWKGAFNDPINNYYNMPNYIIYDHMIYPVFTIQLSFHEALSFCHSVGMDLVSIPSLEENDEIHNMISRLTDTQNMLFWSGGSKVIDRNTWSWVKDGTLVNLLNWLPEKATDSNKNCISLIYTKDHGLAWNAEDCTVRMNFLCSIEYAPDETDVEDYEEEKLEAQYDNDFL
ncbi:unnamed protein product [Psylliodes chrysocephalus]|uniref:C-type lectin domain-containing protein n=1 Tax=Psylliodes chrysocephalus TaxID=3402493 RepID=A0A9P0CJU7_9CUCU|nr:unnamed protein product [Psylliodes chrysocephala]